MYYNEPDDSKLLTTTKVTVMSGVRTYDFYGDRCSAYLTATGGTTGGMYEILLVSGRNSRTLRRYHRPAPLALLGAGSSGFEPTANVYSHAERDYGVFVCWLSMQRQTPFNVYQIFSYPS